MTLIIIILPIIITIIIRCKSRILTTTNTKYPVTLYNGRKPFTNITESSMSDVTWVLYAPLNRLDK